jgi:hypothetical protein
MRRMSMRVESGRLPNLVTASVLHNGLPFVKYRDRKMPSFYALQILNGKRHDLKDLLKPPVKPFGSVSDVFT